MSQEIAWEDRSKKQKEGKWKNEIKVLAFPKL